MNLRLLKLLLFLFVVLMSSCKKKIFERESFLYCSKEFKEENRDQVAFAKKFVDDLVYSYDSTIKAWGINPKFYDSLSLMKKNEISAKCYISTSREFLIEVFKDSSNTRNFYGVSYPVQLYIAQGIDKTNRPVYIDSNFYKSYDSFIGDFDIHGKDRIYINGAVLDGIDYAFELESRAKFFNFKKNAILYLTGVKLIGLDEEGKKSNIHLLSNKGIAVMTRDIDISHWMDTAKNAGSEFAISEIVLLFRRSLYFREALANDKLMPLALAISSKMKKSKENLEYEYTGSDFKNDLLAIDKRIDSFNIKISANGLFADADLKTRVGTLLWLYDGYKEYMWQWAIINCAILILVLILTLSNMFPLLERTPWTKRFLLGIIGSFNLYIIACKPRGYYILYFWPALIVLLIYFVLYFKELCKHNQNLE